MIFDCSHSESGTKYDDDETSNIARCVNANDLPPLPLSVDTDLFPLNSSAHAASMVRAGFSNRALRSHVFLAACGENEVAWEREGRGVFTNALLETLRQFGPDGMTYAGLVQKLPSLPR